MSKRNKRLLNCDLFMTGEESTMAQLYDFVKKLVAQTMLKGRFPVEIRQTINRLNTSGLAKWLMY